MYPTLYSASASSTILQILLDIIHFVERATPPLTVSRSTRCQKYPLIIISRLLSKKSIDIFRQSRYNMCVETHRQCRAFGVLSYPSPFVDGRWLKRRLPDYPRVRKGRRISSPRGNLIPGGSRYGHFKYYWKYL